MRVVSLVPSWTETLVEAGVNVVGRTRYCIHPDSKVAGIPSVGGTKDWNWELIQSLAPDLLILDREENPKFMSEQNEIPALATHIESLQDVAPALERLSKELGAEKLREWANRWRLEGLRPHKSWDRVAELPGVLEWGSRPVVAIENVQYMIWQRPWMAVSRDTFIGSVLGHLGVELENFSTKYPVVEFGSEPDPTTLLLFSSEPFPFRSVFASLKNLGRPYALVDGECFSWFGIRTLRFLEKSHVHPTP